jgi:type I restriction enzyme S subunit
LSFPTIGRKIKDAATGTSNSMKNISKGSLLCLIVPTPKPDEQTAIANALSEVDALINELEKLIVKKQAIKTATMQQLLTGRTRLPQFALREDGTQKGYKQSELGEIPEDWVISNLGEVADITKLAGFEYSNYFNSYKNGGEIIVIRGVNITNNVIDLSDVKYIPRTTSNLLPRSQLKKQDLVFAYVGTIGPIYLVEDDNKFHLGPNTAKITCKDEILPTYALVYFKSLLIKKEIDERTSIGAQPSLSMSKIRSFKIIVPSEIKEQTAIATILTDMDTEIQTLQQRLSKTRQIKQGMMQELLTGRIRLVKPEVAA